MRSWLVLPLEVLTEDSSALKNKKAIGNPIAFLINYGSYGWTRTTDPSIMNAVL